MSKNSSRKDNLISARDYAEQYGDTEENIVDKIRDGTLAGEIKENVWYVNSSLSDDNRSRNNKSSVEIEPQFDDIDPNLVGIRGWLILPAIGFVVVPIVGVVSLGIGISSYSKVSAAGYGGIFQLEILAASGMLIYYLYAATLFFGEKSKAPSTIIALMIVGIVVSGLLLMIELGIGATTFAVESGKSLAKGIVSAAIWIPYFRMSKRVKATFSLLPTPKSEMELNAATRSGEVGVQWDGYLGIVTADPSPRLKTLVEKTNETWKAKYQIISKKRRKELSDIEKVFGKKRMENAEKGTYVKNSEDEWEKKA